MVQDIYKIVVIEGIFSNHRLGTDLFFAIFGVIIFYIVMEKTVFGYELRSVGYNANASKFVGMKVNRNTILSMAISGAFAGLGGALYNMGPVWTSSSRFYIPRIWIHGYAVAPYWC